VQGGFGYSGRAEQMGDSGVFGGFFEEIAV